MGFLEELTVLPSPTDPCGFQCNTEATLSESKASSSLISGTYQKINNEKPSLSHIHHRPKKPKTAAESTSSVIIKLNVLFKTKHWEFLLSFIGENIHSND